MLMLHFDLVQVIESLRLLPYFMVSQASEIQTIHQLRDAQRTSESLSFEPRRRYQ